MAADTDDMAIAPTGVPGLDDVLMGGLTEGNIFLLEGAPGTGKTTIALRFLISGAQAGDRGLYITLSETERELRNGAASHGWHLDENIEVFEVVPPESLLDAEKRTGRHEETIREFRVGQAGLTVGAPLKDFQGVLHGVPSFVGNAGPLLNPALTGNGNE